MAPNVGTLRPGELFHERYRVLRCIAAGGMGAIYEVRDERTDVHRALKVMLPTLVQDAGMRSRFEREARVTAKIESDHIVQVSDAAIDPATGTPFLVMDLLRGEDLRAMLRAQRALPVAEVLTYLGQTARALDKTHAAGVVHRDLKPDNLFVTRRDDGTPCVKILDFGIAKVVAESRSAQGTQIVGTPTYMSPEQIRGEGTIGPRSDIYALGHIAYTLLVGEAYWKEELRASESMFPLLARVAAGAVEPPCERAARRRGVALPAGFDAWFARATALSPEERFERASVAIAVLADVLVGGAPRASSVEPALAPSRDRIEPTTLPVAPATAPAAESDGEVMKTGTTTGAVSSDARAARGPRSRALSVAGVAGGLALLVGIGVLLAQRGREESPRAAASATASAPVMASASASAAIMPVVSADAPPSEVLPSANAVASAAEAGSASAVPEVTATASALRTKVPSRRTAAAPRMAPSVTPAPSTPEPAASASSQWKGIR